MWYDAYYDLWRPKDNRDCAVDVISRESVFLETVINRLENRRVVIQAGGHIGINPIILSKVFDEVYTVEPILENYNCLVENTFPYKNIFCKNVAFADKEEDLRFVSLGELNSGAWQVNTKLGSIEQKSITIDSLSLDNVDFIQLDVEGYELFALQGAKETIAKWHPAIMVEERDHGPSPKDYLTSIGYKEITRSDTDVVYTYEETVNA